MGKRKENSHSSAANNRFPILTRTTNKVVPGQGLAQKG